MNQKKEAANTYTYFPNGWLSNRLDSPSRATRDYYDEVGNLKTNSYVSAGTSILDNYDNAQWLTSMTDAIGASTFRYTYSGRHTRLATETPPSAWTSSALTHTYANTSMLEDNFSMLQPGGASAWQQTYTYSAGRPLTVATPAGTFTHTYVAGSPSAGAAD